MKNINLSFGGITKESLIRLLNERDIMINSWGEELLRSEFFQVSIERQQTLLTEISLDELGFKEGANLLEIIKAAHKKGLNVCPVDVASFLRLDYEQKNTHGMSKISKLQKEQLPLYQKSLTKKQLSQKDFILGKLMGNYG